MVRACDRSEVFSRTSATFGDAREKVVLIDVGDQVIPGVEFHLGVAVGYHLHQRIPHAELLERRRAIGPVEHDVMAEIIQLRHDHGILQELVCLDALHDALDARRLDVLVEVQVSGGHDAQIRELVAHRGCRQQRNSVAGASQTAGVRTLR